MNVTIARLQLADAARAQANCALFWDMRAVAVMRAYRQLWTCVGTSFARFKMPSRAGTALVRGIVVISLPGAKPERSESERAEAIQRLVAELQQRNPFGDIEDPVDWQRKVRAERELPGR